MRLFGLLIGLLKIAIGLSLIIGMYMKWIMVSNPWLIFAISYSAVIAISYGIESIFQDDD